MSSRWAHGADAREALRHRDLRQGLYDEACDLMEHVIVNLQGAAHTSRRRLENRLFRRETFFRYERDDIPRTVERMLAPRLAEGAGDLVPLARRIMMSLAPDIAGVDRARPAVSTFVLAELASPIGAPAHASTSHRP